LGYSNGKKVKNCSFHAAAMEKAGKIEFRREAAAVDTMYTKDKIRHCEMVASSRS